MDEAEKVCGELRGPRTPDRPCSCGCVDLGALVTALREVKSLPECPPELRWFVEQIAGRL